MKMNSVIAVFIIAMIILFILTCIHGCVAVNQEAIHHKTEHALSSNGPIRWYQYNRLWFNNGGKPPAGVGGILYTIFSPSDWFWYGPYDSDIKYNFKRIYKKDCIYCNMQYNLRVQHLDNLHYECDYLHEQGNEEGSKKKLDAINKYMQDNYIWEPYNMPYAQRFK